MSQDGNFAQADPWRKSRLEHDTIRFETIIPERQERAMCALWQWTEDDLRSRKIEVDGVSPPTTLERCAPITGRSDKCLVLDKIAAIRTTDYEARRLNVLQRRLHVKGMEFADQEDALAECEYQSASAWVEGPDSGGDQGGVTDRQNGQEQSLIDSGEDQLVEQAHSVGFIPQAKRAGSSSPARQTSAQGSLCMASTAANQRWNAMEANGPNPGCDEVVGRALPPATARGVMLTPTWHDSPRHCELLEEWHHSCDKSLEAKRRRVREINLRRAHRRAEMMNKPLAGQQNDAVEGDEDARQEDSSRADQRAAYINESREAIRAFRMEKRRRSQRRKAQCGFVAGTGTVAQGARKCERLNERCAEIANAQAHVAAMRDELDASLARGALAFQRQKNRAAQHTRHAKQTVAYIRLLQNEDTTHTQAEKTKRIRAAREVRKLLDDAKQDLCSQERKLFDSVEFEEYEDALQKFMDISIVVKGQSVIEGGLEDSMEQSIERGGSENFGFEQFPITSTIENLFAPKPHEHGPARTHTPRGSVHSRVDGQTAVKEDCGLSVTDNFLPADYMPPLIPAPPPPLPPLKVAPLSGDITFEQDRTLPAWSRPMTQVVMEIKKLPAARLSSIRKIRQTGPFSAR